MSKMLKDLEKLQRELGLDPSRRDADRAADLAVYLQRAANAAGMKPDKDGRYVASAFGLASSEDGGRGTPSELALTALSGSASAQVKALRRLLKTAGAIVAAEEKRLALRPKDSPGVLRARISGVVGLAPNRRDLIVTPSPRSKPPAWWHPSDPWPVSQVHTVRPGMSVQVRVGSEVRAGDLLARADATEACLGVVKPTRKGTIGDARTVVLPEPMAIGYTKVDDYPGAASEEEAVVRYVLDEKAKASNYVLEVGEDVARARLEAGDVVGLFRDLKLGGFKVKAKRRMSAREAVAHADRIASFLRGKGAGPGDPAFEKWASLRATWSAMPSEKPVDVQTSRKLPDVEVDAWRWDGVDWVCARGQAIRYRTRAARGERAGEGPVGLLGAVESARRDGGDIEVVYKSRTGEEVQFRLRPERLVARDGVTFLLGIDRRSGERVSLRLVNIVRAGRPRTARERVAYPWAIQAETADASRLLSESTATIETSAEPPPDFTGRIYVWDKELKGFLGSVEFVAADQTPKGRWVWLFRDPQPYGFLHVNADFKPVRGSWPAGRWYIDPAVAADPPNVRAAREMAREGEVSAFVSRALGATVGQPRSVVEELDLVIRAAADRKAPLGAVRAMFAALKSRLPDAKNNPRKGLRRLTR